MGYLPVRSKYVVHVSLTVIVMKQSCVRRLGKSGDGWASSSADMVGSWLSLGGNMLLLFGDLIVFDGRRFFCS